MSRRERQQARLAYAHARDLLARLVEEHHARGNTLARAAAMLDQLDPDCFHRNVDRFSRDGFPRSQWHDDTEIHRASRNTWAPILELDQHDRRFLGHERALLARVQQLEQDVRDVRRRGEIDIQRLEKLVGELAAIYQEMQPMNQADAARLAASDRGACSNCKKPLPMAEPATTGHVRDDAATAIRSIVSTATTSRSTSPTRSRAPKTCARPNIWSVRVQTWRTPLVGGSQVRRNVRPRTSERTTTTTRKPSGVVKTTARVHTR
jgi:hypothetical protein